MNLECIWLFGHFSQLSFLSPHSNITQPWSFFSVPLSSDFIGLDLKELFEMEAVGTFAAWDLIRLCLNRLVFNGQNHS